MRSTRLLSGDEPESELIQPPKRQLFMVEPFAVNANYFGGYRIVPSSRSLSEPEPLDTVVPPTITTSPRDLVAAATDIAHELVVDFGAAPSRSLLRLDGSVDPVAASTPNVRSFRQWAADRDLLGSDDQG
jgi:hypothetical protein